MVIAPKKCFILKISILNNCLASETEFEPILRRRLNLFGLDCDDSLRHLMFRNDRELYFFNHMLQQLYQLHDILQKIPQEDEKIFVSNKIRTNFRTIGPDER